MNSRILLLIPLLIILASCKPEQGSQSTPLDDPQSQVPEFKDYKFTALDGSEITGDENIILGCISEINFCQSLCISQPFPEYQRFSVVKTDFVSGGTCYAYALSYTDNDGLAEVKYFEGTHDGSTCSGMDINSPDFEGLFSTNEVQVPEGQVSPHPQGHRLYYTFNLVEDDISPVASFILRTYQPVPASNTMYLFSYTDPAIGVETTFSEVHGFTCVKDSELSGVIQ